MTRLASAFAAAQSPLPLREECWERGDCGALSGRDRNILANLCGRGTKDIFTVAEKLGVEI